MQSGIDEVNSCDVFVVATANEIRELPSSLLAGRAAVELKVGRTDVGASSDLERAGRIVQRFVTDYGACGFPLLHTDTGWSVDSGKHNDEIVVERNALLSRCYEEAKAVLRAHWPFVEKLAATLTERDTLIYEEIVALRNEAA